MKYEDGKQIKAGDIVLIDETYVGQVVASIDTSEYLPGHESWAYLSEGIMVHTEFAGFVHYTVQATDHLTLVERGAIK